eukprot:CAMPEP_0174701092 /NCGR_PEP_ID=MMETSP1094-20130205/5842_1 /TAXON_ID=156173 /ORGANISM="Chrysochromulina brevifilum, Strain UTEX LB 985" /LENGTH=65 /DNA_ID=CAMNT_0015898687 /DNA_START=297 /DNA_END=491 /DNA_ORIENTATION=+
MTMIAATLLPPLAACSGGDGGGSSIGSRALQPSVWQTTNPLRLSVSRVQPWNSLIDTLAQQPNTW